MNILRKCWQWFDERTGLGELIKPMALHPVPPGSKWWYVFGSATLIAFIIQVVTGIALATLYVPSGGEAYASLQYISTQAPFGRLLRGMHYFGASAMVLFVGIHMTRVFLMAAYKYPREVNWLTGVLLLGLTVAMGFSGQLLRWDQNAVWSTIVGADQAARAPVIGKWLAQIVLSGPSVGSETVSHIFVLHVFIIPALLMAIIGLHLYLVLRNGISEPPVVGQPVDPKTYRDWYHTMLEKSGVPFWPNAAWRDLIFGSCVMLGVVVLAWIFGPLALDNPPNPSLVDANPKPDWYLLWYFAVLALLPHAAEDYVILLAPVMAGLVLLSVPFISNKGERSWRRRPWAPLTVLFIVTCIAVLWQAGIRERWTPDFSVKPLSDQIIGVSSGPVHDGGMAFNIKGCLYCHAISGQGGTRGPDLTQVGERLTKNQIVIRILNGGYNMPAYANNLTPQQLEAMTAFLQSRKSQ
jgi:ubiquinol-cytochrome c reductase cytochrome b subunit